MTSTLPTPADVFVAESPFGPSSIGAVLHSSLLSNGAPGRWGRRGWGTATSTTTLLSATPHDCAPGAPPTSKRAPCAVRASAIQASQAARPIPPAFPFSGHCPFAQRHRPPSRFDATARDQLPRSSTQRARIQASWRRRLATPWRRREIRFKRSGASESETYQQLRFCRLSATWRPAAIDSCTGNHVPNARLDGIGGWLSSRVFTEPLLGSPSRTLRPRPVPRPAPEGFPAEASPRPSLPTAGSSRSRGVSAGRRAACVAWTQREEPRWERDETQRALQVASACGSSDWLPAAPPSFSPSDSIA